MKLTEFLLARIAEDERRATSIYRVKPGGYGLVEQALDESDWVRVDGQEMSGTEFRHRFTEHTPDARVLAECEAKRRIIETHRHADHSFGNGRAECPTMPRPLAESTIFRDMPACDTLLLLAAVYAFHPDYREEWRP